MYVPEEHDYESREETEDDEEIESGEDDEMSSDKIKNLSEYEIRRMYRIAENKKNFKNTTQLLQPKKLRYYPQSYTCKNCTLSVMYTL